MPRGDGTGPTGQGAIGRGSGGRGRSGGGRGCRRQGNRGAGGACRRGKQGGVSWRTTQAPQAQPQPPSQDQIDAFPDNGKTT